MFFENAPNARLRRGRSDLLSNLRPLGLLRTIFYTGHREGKDMTTLLRTPAGATTESPAPADMSDLHQLLLPDHEWIIAL